MDLIVLIIILWAAASAVEDVKKHLRTSRQERISEREKQIAPKTLSKTQRRATAARHDTGWWWREATHGFPVARYGWRTGWVAHQAAHEQQKAIHAQHKGVLESFRATRQQGQANAAVIEAGPGQMSRQEMKQKLQAASPPAQSQGQQSPVPAAAPAPMPAAAGAPVEPAAAVPPVPVSEPVKGDIMPAQAATAETTYSQDISKCNKIIVSCDIEGARLRAEQMAAHVEEMVAAGLDSRHTGMAADLADRIQEQIKANQATHDHAQALRDSIIRTHSAGHEYHSSTVDGGASKEYLRD